MEAAFWSALLVTIAGSVMPAETMSSYSPVRALKPVVVPVSDPLRHDGPVGPGVDRDLLYRFLQRPVDDQGARPLVAVQGVEQFSHRSLGVQQGHAAAWHDTLFEGRAGRRERVLHAVLLLP